jgi:hypothetical protein
MGLQIREALYFVFGHGYFTFAQFVFLLHHEAIVLSENHDYGNWSSPFRMETWRLQLQGDSPFP